VKTKIRWTSLALKDLLEMKSYIQQDNPTAAAKEAAKIIKSTSRLSRFPLSGRLLQTIPTLREIISGNYRIFYRVHSNQIEILRVYHGKRKPIDIA